MTATLLEEYIRVLDSKLAKDKCKDIFFMDNWLGHGKIDNLEAITMKFLLPNITSVLQPMDKSVIETARKLYRKSLLRSILLAYDGGNEYEIDL